MIGWWIAGYSLTVLGCTRVGYTRYLDKEIDRYQADLKGPKPSCRSTCDDRGSYHSVYCQRDLKPVPIPKKSEIVSVAFALSLGWPIILPLYIIIQKPSKAEKLEAKRLKELQAAREIERLKREYNL